MPEAKASRACMKVKVTEAGGQMPVVICICLQAQFHSKFPKSKSSSTFPSHFQVVPLTPNYFPRFLLSLLRPLFHQMLRLEAELSLG